MHPCDVLEYQVQGNVPETFREARKIYKGIKIQMEIMVFQNAEYF